MNRLLCLAVALCCAGATARAQDPSPAAGRCAIPDTIVFRGGVRTADASMRNETGLVPGPVNYRAVERAIKALYALGQFDDVQTTCELQGPKRTALVFQVRERPLLAAVDVTGTDRVPRDAVRDRVDLLIARPLDPAQVSRAAQRIDSLYQAEGYYLAKVTPETTMVNGQVSLMFHVDEGRRLAVSGVDVRGNSGVSDKDIVEAMSTKPEGFLWLNRGELDADKYAADVSEKIPSLYASRGYLDAQVLKDTLVVDRSRGKALVKIDVKEGPRYRIGSFEVIGSRHFSAEDIARFYPFGVQPKTITGAVKGLIRATRGREDTTTYFDQSRWDEATRSVGETYANEGYIYAQVHPVVVRRKAGPDSIPTVDLRWEVDERSPAIVNRVEVLGNDITSESCIRNQIFVVPGDVFRRDALIRSYQNIGNLGFFETPLPPPDTRPANDQGDVDVIFRVKEKHTGNVNFGASVGQGAGVGGFIGFDQPNLFGLCKRGSLNWQFGQYINDFSLSYTDPFIMDSQYSGTITAYHSQQRYYVSDVGRQTRVGGQAQLGFPLWGSRFHRLFVSYGGERVSYGTDGLAGTINCGVVTCARSTVGLSYDHDTRTGLPFPTDGGHQAFSTQVNGFFGGAKYTRYTGEMKHYASLAQFGGGGLGSEPVVLTLGLGARAGAVFGDPGGFFVSQKFSLGGVQYGEPLRGYEEFSITPRGYVGSATGSVNAQVNSFGNAFFTNTAELGLRFNQQLYVDAFYDAGNIWARPQDFNPTRLFRGAGIGASVVTPLGPLGLDWGYGFDRVENGVKAPKWQLHFKLGQLF